MPYILVAVCVLLFRPLGGADLAPYLIVVVPFCCILNIICIVNLVLGNLHTLRVGDSRGAAVRNLAVKLLHIPVHLALFAISMGFMNPFLMAFLFIPFFCGVGLLTYSGVMNIAGCIRLFRENKLSLKKSVLLCVCGFVYVVDVIAAVVQCNIAKKEQIILNTNYSTTDNIEVIDERT